MARYRGASLRGLMVRAAHAETCATWRPPALAMPEPLPREELLRQKAGLEATAQDLALWVSAFREPEIVAEFEDIIARLKIVERDLALLQECV